MVVCNGHYSDPYIPDLPGMASFQGEIDHSHNYRENSRFAGKTVAFLGAHASGMDIAIEAAEKAKQVTWTDFRQQLCVFRCAVEVVSVRPSVRSSPVIFRRVLGASCAMYPALFSFSWAVLSF